MPLIARGLGSGDIVTCHEHGTVGTQPCNGTLVAPLTDKCSPNVFVADFGAVRLGDIMLGHMRNFDDPKCEPHTPPCNTASPNVFVNNILVARQTDTYFETNNHTITGVAQTTVFANG
jgi:uncharacterized Zn-binding protein involved in type VI secretion